MKPEALKSGHTIALLQGGDAFFPALVQALDASAQEIRLETYIFQFEGAPEQVAAALVRAAQRGVAVFLIMDGVGTPHVPDTWMRQFADAGVHWHRFSPLGSGGLLRPVRWRRLHRKLCVVDAQVAFCGGINQLDDYRDPHHGLQPLPRFDFAVRVEGPLVADIHAVMVQFWERLVTTRQLEALQLKNAGQALRKLVPQWRSRHSGERTPGVTGEGGALAALVLRDNVRYRSSIERAYRKAIGEARKEVVIANAYFLPGGKLRRALIHAARRGVRVRLLLQGRYEYFMQYHAARPVYGALLAAGVEIHEYQAGFLHAKVAVVDGQWSTVGSSNLDPLSLLLAREANVVVRDEAFASQLHRQLVLAMETHGVALHPQTYASRPWQQRFLDQLAYGLMRLSILLTGMRY